MTKLGDGSLLTIGVPSHGGMMLTFASSLKTFFAMSTTASTSWRVCGGIGLPKSTRHRQVDRQASLDVHSSSGLLVEDCSAVEIPTELEVDHARTQSHFSEETCGVGGHHTGQIGHSDGPTRPAGHDSPEHSLLAKGTAPEP